MVTREQMRGHPPAPERAVDPDADTVVDAPIVATEPTEAEPDDDASPGDDTLPDHVTENPDGSWTYRLQWLLAPSKADPEGTDIATVKLPPRVFMRDILAASKEGATGEQTTFAIICAVSNTPESVMKRVDFLDFKAIANAFDKLRLRTVRRRAAPPNPS